MLEAMLLVTAISIDAFVASVAYGANKIKIPFYSVLTINIVCTLLLGISLYFGAIIREVVPGNFVGLVGIIILLCLGIYQLFEGLFKNIIQKYLVKNKKVNFHLFNFRFVLEVYVDETKADFDKSRRLNVKEAFALAVALSVDGLAAGFGTALGNTNYIQILLFSLIFHMAAIWSGVHVGQGLARRININMSWVSGIIIISLALIRLISL